MIRRLVRRTTSGTALVGLLVLTATSIFGQGPVYRDRLHLPGGEDAFGYPKGVTADLVTGEIFVSDSRDHRLVIFDREGLFSFEIPGGRVFSAPNDVAVDPEGYLLVAAYRRNRNVLIELDFDGLFLRTIEFTGLPEDALPPEPASVALSPDGTRMFVLDRANKFIWIADRDGRVLQSIDLAPNATEEDRLQVGVRRVDVYDDVVVVARPRKGQIELYGLDGDLERRVGDPGNTSCKLGSPTAAAMDAEGNLVIIDQLRMYIIRWQPTTNRCLGDYYGFGDLEGFLYYPMDITLDQDGRIFVSQGFESRVQIYDGLPPAAGSFPLSTSAQN